MNDQPDSTAVRTALWRALHVQIDQSPPVFDDVIGLQLAAPDADWRTRPDMDPGFTAGFRASIVSRARFIDELLDQSIAAGVDQFVILGAGLDTTAQRRPELGQRLQIFEIDQPATQAWKRRRLDEEGFGVPTWLHLVPVDFESGQNWWDRLVSAGFDPSRPAFVAATGVAMYLTEQAIVDTLGQLAGLATGSMVAMTFMLPVELLASADQAGLKASASGAKSSGTPFVSFYSPEQFLDLAQRAGFAAEGHSVEHVASGVLSDRYFSQRSDGLRPSTGEDFLIART